MIRILKKYTRDRSGFSFAELMVVIALIGVLSAIALPSFLRGLPEKRLKNAARNLYADMQKARLLAVKENKKISVRFENDAAGDFYYFDEDSNTTDPGYKKWNNNEFRRNLSEYGAISYGKGAANTNWNADPISSITTNITFNSTGTAGPQGPTYLQNQNKDVCYAVSTTMYGEVKIRRFNGSKWPED